jgi:hypothetical protein
MTSVLCPPLSTADVKLNRRIVIAVVLSLLQLCGPVLVGGDDQSSAQTRQLRPEKDKY